MSDMDVADIRKLLDDTVDKIAGTSEPQIYWSTPERAAIAAGAYALMMDPASSLIFEDNAPKNDGAKLFNANFTVALQAAGHADEHVMLTLPQVATQAVRVLNVAALSPTFPIAVRNNGQELTASL